MKGDPLPLNVKFHFRSERHESVKISLFTQVIECTFVDTGTNNVQNDSLPITC